MVSRNYLLRRGFAPAAWFAAAALSTLALGATAEAGPTLFDTIELPSNQLSIFPKWTGVLERYLEQSRLPEGDCTETTFTRCHLREWSAFLETLRGAPQNEALQAVNDYLNEARYIEDIVNYGVIDYWATPKEFLENDGDCEDYSIAKFLSLRTLGFPNDSLRIVVLQDLNLGIAHAVLAVYLNEGIMILDNQVDAIVPAERIHHYQPYYSINETLWWLHAPL